MTLLAIFSRKISAYQLFINGQYDQSRNEHENNRWFTFLVIPHYKSGLELVWCTSTNQLTGLRSGLFNPTQFQIWKTRIKNLLFLDGCWFKLSILFADCPSMVSGSEPFWTFLIARYVVNRRRLAAPYCIPLHVSARGEQCALCATPLGRPIISLLPADTDLHMGRRTSTSLCVPLWKSAQCVLDPTEGLWCCGKVNLCHFTFNGYAHRNLTFI